MTAELGYISLLLSFFATLYAVFAAFRGEQIRNEALVMSARNAVYVAAGLISFSTGLLFYALMVQDYSISYVWSVSSPSMPDFFRATALWGSQAGSLLFWSFLMALFTACGVFLNWRSHRRLMPGFIVYAMAVLAFFIGLSVFVENPFLRWWLDYAMPEGRQVVQAVFMPDGLVSPTYSRLAETANGLNPLLRHFGMAIHPPMLYLGFVGFVIPFAFAMAALGTGDLSSNWIKASRRWTLVAWLFLSLGLILGGRWAYDVLGWGGYWGWDPVENAAFLPWLMGTAFLHSVMIQEQRGMLKVWNMFLVILTFSAVIFGTFATRSGLVESVHSFAQSGIGFPMFMFWFAITFVSVGLILWRRSQGLLEDEHQFKSIFSRESVFVLNNLVFVALFVAIFWGSFGAPITSELAFGTNITLGTDYFMRVTPPLFVLLYILMAVAPISAWGISSVVRVGKGLVVPLILTAVSLTLFYVIGMQQIYALFGYGIVTLAGWVALYETFKGYQARRKTQKEAHYLSLAKLFQRNPRRYGGYLIHFGVAIIGIGVIGSTIFQQETQQTIPVGESIFIDKYELRYDRLDTNLTTTDGRIVDRASLSLYENGRFIGEIHPRRDFFPEGEMSTMTIAGAHSSLENDFYVLLVGWEEISSQAATFKVYINPLINLVWWGSIILIFGTIAAAWPRIVLPVQARESMRKTKEESA